MRSFVFRRNRMGNRMCNHMGNRKGCPYGAGMTDGIRRGNSP